MSKTEFGAAMAAVIVLAAGAATAGPQPLPASIATYTLYEPWTSGTNYTNATFPVGQYLNNSDPYDDSVFGFTAANFNGGGPGAGITVLALGSGDIALKYYYEISSPLNESVNIDLTGSIYAFGYPFPDPGTAVGSISGSVGLPAGGYYAQGCASFEAPGCPAGANFGTTPVSVVLSVPTNTYEWIDLDVRVDSQDYGSEFVAQVDPILSLDPSVSDPQDFQILVSPDVQNGYVPTVPEPATWAMLLMGFGGLGGVLRTTRKRRRQADSAA